VSDIVIFWDDDDDPDGNYWQLCVEGHGLTREEVEEVLLDGVERAAHGVRLDIFRRARRCGV
jgi:hypothetical protein